MSNIPFFQSLAVKTKSSGTVFSAGEMDLGGISVQFLPKTALNQALRGVSGGKMVRSETT